MVRAGALRVMREAEGAGLVQLGKGTEETDPDTFLDPQRKNRKPWAHFETKRSSN